MKKNLVYIIFCISIIITFTGCSQSNIEKSTSTNQNISADTEKVKDINYKVITLSNTALSNTALSNTELSNTAINNTAIKNTAINITALRNTVISNTELSNTVVNNTAINDTESKSIENNKSNLYFIDDSADRFEYDGVKYLYSELQFIQSQDYTYFILDEDKKEISITKISNAEGELVIPSELDGYKVVCLGVPLHNFSAYEEGLYEPKSQYGIIEKEDINNVTGLMIPEGIKQIGMAAFKDMAHLKQISLPESLETIGIEAFANNGIEELNLPKNLQLIDISAFYGCEALASVTVNCSKVMGGGEYPSFKSCNNIEEVTWGNVENADVDLFSLSKVKRVVIPSSVKTVEMVCCDIETLIFEGKNTIFTSNRDLGKLYWNDKFSIILPEGSIAIKTIKGLSVNYKEVTLPKAMSIKKTKINSNHIKLTWNKQSNITKYQIYYSETKNGNYKLLKETDKQTYTTTKVKGYVKVRSFITYQRVNWYGEYKLVKL